MLPFLFLFVASVQRMIPAVGTSIAVVGSNFGSGQPSNYSTLQSWLTDIGSNVTVLEWLAVDGRGVTVDGLPCDVTAWNETMILCAAPPGSAAV